jgi:hypothetical protein
MIEPEGKRGQAYNLNITVSGILVPDGRCNWHISPKCYTRPKTNRAFWDCKREDNITRDRRVNRQLRRQGWKVIRIWQLPSVVYAALRLSCSGINPPKSASTASAASSRGSGLALCFYSGRPRPALTVGQLANCPTVNLTSCRPNRPRQRRPELCAS